MHSPHNPQPTLNLGDDPDPAAEIGSRLAASSQTAQGLLTNYLFYGQRRSGGGQGSASTDLTRGQTLEGWLEGVRSASADHITQTTDSERTDLRDDLHAADADGSAWSAHPRGVQDRPRLRLLRRSERTSPPDVPASGGASLQETGRLASSTLSSDSLGQDPLATPLEPEVPLTAQAAPTCQSR